MINLLCRGIPMCSSNDTYKCSGPAYRQLVSQMNSSSRSVFNIPGARPKLSSLYFAMYVSRTCFVFRIDSLCILVKADEHLRAVASSPTLYFYPCQCWSTPRSIPSCNILRRLFSLPVQLPSSHPISLAWRDHPKCPGRNHASIAFSVPLVHVWFGPYCQCKCINAFQPLEMIIKARRHVVWNEGTYSLFVAL